MTPTKFVDRLAAVELNDVFNPYSDHCPNHDLVDAPRIRRRNLLNLLTAAQTLKVDSLWVGRDLGYRGGRRTGLALTDEASLSELSEVFGGISLKRATAGPPVSERTAAVIWRALREIKKPVFMWNAFPLHPHEPNRPFTNRCHSSSERQHLRPLFFDLLEILQPRHVVTIGRDASFAVVDAGIQANAVRHPSYGGQAEFLAGVATIYDIPVERLGSTQRQLWPL